MLNYLYKLVKQLKELNNIFFKTFARVYNYCIEAYASSYIDDYYSNILLAAKDKGFKEELNIKREGITKTN